MNRGCALTAVDAAFFFLLDLKAIIATIATSAIPSNPAKVSSCQGLALMSSSGSSAGLAFAGFVLAGFAFAGFASAGFASAGVASAGLAFAGLAFAGFASAGLASLAGLAFTTATGISITTCRQSSQDASFEVFDESHFGHA